MKENQTPLNIALTKPSLLLMENLQIKKKFPKIKYCLIYAIVVSSLYLPFIINYFLSSNAFNSNNYLYISSEILCNNTINELTKSLKLNSSEKYIQKNTEVEKCYNKALDFNKKCFMYLSEMCLCKKENKKCSWINRDLKDCSSRFNFSQINDLSQYCIIK